jgi:hypothetical protein
MGADLLRRAKMPEPMSLIGHFRPISPVLPAGSCLHPTLKADLRLAARRYKAARLGQHIAEQQSQRTDLL